MRTFIAISLLLHIAHTQIFEGELSVRLQPPPLQPQPKSDFGSVSFQDVSQAPQHVRQGPSQVPIGPQQQVPIGPQQQVPIGPPPPKAQLAHHTVLFTAEQEAKLPPDLLNPFYKNPRIAEQLAKQSWFGPGENLVGDRETEKIPRDKIYYALTSAGLIRRKRYELVW